MSIDIEEKESAHIAFIEATSALILSFAAYQEWCRRGAHRGEHARAMLDHMLSNADALKAMLEQRRAEMRSAEELRDTNAACNC